MPVIRDPAAPGATPDSSRPEAATDARLIVSYRRPTRSISSDRLFFTLPALQY
jgi:hypothetical protein